MKMIYLSLFIIMVMISNNNYAQRFKTGSTSRPSRMKPASVKKTVKEKEKSATSIHTSSSSTYPTPALGSAGARQLAGTIKRDMTSKTLTQPVKAAPILAARGNLTAENSGRLNLHKFREPESYKPANLQPDNYSLYLPNKHNIQQNWKQNFGSLRSAMKIKKPITDTYRNGNGKLKVPKKGFFLRAEREALKVAGWKYEPKLGSWMPPTN